MTELVPPRSAWTRQLPWALLALSLLLRLPHFLGPLDDPHAWRQCDTVDASRTFARDGLDLLHPSVSWLGGHGTLIFELPLPEAAAALLHRAFGFDPLWDRVVAFAAFLLALFFFHRLVRAFAGARVAPLATLLYAVAPLAQFFSRAPTVDFAATACAHGFLWFTWRTLRGTHARGSGRWRHALLASLCGALAAGIKGPYLFPVLLPLLFAPPVGGGRRSPLTWLPLALSAIAFVVWRAHVNAVNAAAPDWSWLPGYYKEVNPWWWYVGSWSERLAPSAWVTLARRFALEVTNPGALLLAVAALVWARAKPAAGHDATPGEDAGAVPGIAPALAWVAGATAYLLVFFPLNVRHDYYQVPFLAPLAWLAAAGAVAIESRAGRAGRLAGSGLLWGGVLLAMFVLPGRLGYYHVDALRVAAGAAIAAHVPPHELVVVVDHSSEYSDPRLLHRADRHGWAVKAEDARPELLARLASEGARWLAWVEEPGVERLVPPAYVTARSSADIPLRVSGVALGTLHVVRLTPGVAEGK